MLEQRDQLRALYVKYQHTFDKRAWVTNDAGLREYALVGHANHLQRAVVLRALYPVLKKQLYDFMVQHQERGEIGEMHAVTSANTCVFIVEDEQTYQRLLPRLRAAVPLEVTRYEFGLPGLNIRALAIGPVPTKGIEAKNIVWMFVKKSTYEKLLKNKEHHPFFNLAAFSKIPAGFHFGCEDFE